MPLVFAFLGGLAGSMHCVGMCGIFPLALTEAGGSRFAVLKRQLLYQLGRVNTLMAIGAVAGVLGITFLAGGAMPAGERVLAVVAGGFMIAVGLEQLGLLAGFSAGVAALVRSTLGRVLASVMHSRSSAAPLALGVFNAFLPCQLIYAFAAQAASTASISGGAAIMLTFGLGTVPAMMALGLTPTLLTSITRARIARGGAALVILYGLLTVARGLWPDSVHVHWLHRITAFDG